jgi:hypothetical protein
MKPPGFFKLGSCFSFLKKLLTFLFILFLFSFSNYLGRLALPCLAPALPYLSPQTDILQQEVQGRPG